MMQHVKDVYQWTRKHELAIITIIIICILATSVAIMSQQNGQITLLKEQLTDKDGQLEIANLLYNDAISQIVDLQTQIEQKETELVTLREALNRVVMAP